MPQAPKCKVCGSSHFGGKHVWPGAPAGQVKEVVRTRIGQPASTTGLAAENAALKARVADLEAELAAIRQPPKTADRAAYMRDWRARKKLEGAEG